LKTTSTPHGGTREAGLYTIFSLSWRCPAKITKQSRRHWNSFKNGDRPVAEPPHRSLSINYIQALPGTRVYEFAREKGLIGKSLADEKSI